jgi:hypothetical protein
LFTRFVFLKDHHCMPGLKPMTQLFTASPRGVGPRFLGLTSLAAAAMVAQAGMPARAQTPPIGQSILSAQCVGQIKVDPPGEKSTLSKLFPIGVPLVNSGFSPPDMKALYERCVAQGGSFAKKMKWGNTPSALSLGMVFTLKPVKGGSPPQQRVKQIGVVAAFNGKTLILNPDLARIAPWRFPPEPQTLRASKPTP